MSNVARNRYLERKGSSQPWRLRLLESDADAIEARMNRHDETLFGEDGRGGIVRDVTVLKVKFAVYSALGAFLGGALVHFLP